MATKTHRTASEAQEYHELKQQAAQYYSDNGVPQKMQEILNSMFYDNPGDVFGHLANYFSSFAKTPVISKVQAREAIDSKGHPTLQTELYCTVRNSEKLISTVVSANESHVPEFRLEEKDAEEEERNKFVTAAMHLIQSDLSTALQGLDPCQQTQADALILDVLEKLAQAEEERLAKEKAESGEPGDGGQTSPVETKSPAKHRGSAKSPKGKKGPAVVIVPDEPREKFFCGCNAASALSQVICQSAAKLNEKPVYQHVAELLAGQCPSEYCLPLPVVTILGSGKAWPGKLNCVKEFMVVPRPSMPVKESLKHIMNIYNHVAKTISSKAGVSARNTGDLGCLCPQLDRPEQGLDMIQEAITSLGLSATEDFHIILNSAGHEMFDYDKGKYEVVGGQQKLPEDLAEFWGELTGRYPSIIGIIDPMRKQEQEAWMKLCERISEQCYVIGDQVHHRPGLLKHEQLTPAFRTSGAILRVEHMNTITDIMQAACKLEEADNSIMISANLGDTPDDFISDLAVGLGAKFLKVGAPCRGERVAKLNRLLQIEAELEAQGKLGKTKEHTFPFIKPPTPPPEEPEGANSGAASPK